MSELNSNNNNNNECCFDVGNGSAWNLQASELASNVVNPIRRIVDGMKITPNPDKELIKLSIGDPSVFGNLNAAEECVDAVVEAAKSGKYNGYPSSVGSMEARQAVADYYTDMGVSSTAEDVVLTSGCSQSLELAISLLANPGQNILIPRPGFPLYKTLAHSINVKTRFYDLKPETEWGVDLESLADAIDEDTAAVVVNSPSNPCGGVFTKEHMQEIIAVCEAHKVPIIADEVYEHVVYNGAKFHSFAAVSETVPVFVVSSISKRFLVPGWRLGWVVVQDRCSAITPHMRQCLVALTQRTLGPGSLTQGALPALLKNTPQAVFDRTLNVLEENATAIYEMLSRVPGLTPIKPSGAMYLMVKVDLQSFPDFSSDIQFTERLMTEESVFCLPSSCFSFPGYFRIVLSVPQDKAVEACGRIAQFCERHYLHQVPVPLDANGTPLPSTPQSHMLQRISSSVYMLGTQRN